MADETPKPTLRERAVEAFRGITLAQSIVVTAIIAGTLYAVQVLPDERLEWLLAALAALGIGGTVGLRRSTPEERAPSAPPPPAAPPTRVKRDGSASTDAMLWVLGVAAFCWAWAQRVGWLGLLLLALTLPACATGGGLVGAAAVAKPILDTTCAGARLACRAIDSACSFYEESTAPLTEPLTSGSDASE